MECGSYRGVKLLEHGMKVVERIFEHIIRQQIEVDDMQFGFMKGKATTDAIFTVRQMQENFRVKGNKLYFGLVDLEKLLIGFREQGRNHVFKVGGVQFLGLGYCTEQNTDGIPSFVHCSLLRNGNHTLHQKSWGGTSKFWGSGPP